MRIHQQIPEAPKNFDFKQTPARVIGVENGTRAPGVFRYLTRHGYALAKCVGCDEIYIRK
jgi:hypothetical protein